MPGYNAQGSWLKGEEEKRLFLLVILVSAFFVALYGLYQYVHMLTLQETEWVEYIRRRSRGKAE